MIDFTQKGGAVDFIQPEDDEQIDNGDNGVRGEVLKLSENIKEIRSLEKKIKILESSFDNKN